MFRKLQFNYNFLREVIRIIVPLMLQQLIIASVNLVDNLMVGSLGDVPLSGVSAVNSFYFVVTMSSFGLTSAASVFMAQYYGAKQTDRLKQSFRFMIVSTVLLTSVLVIIGILFPEMVIGYYTKNKEVLRAGVEYMSIVIYSFIPVAIIISINNGIRALGDSKILFVTAILSIVTNVFFNYCLIFGNLGFPRLGIRGAAIATLIARVVECVAVFILLIYKKYPFNSRVVDLLKIESSVAISILVKALPLCINEILWSVGLATVFKFYSTRGIEVMTGYSIAGTINQLFFTLFGGMSMATTVLVSQKLGANQLEEAKKTAYRLVGVSIFLSVIFGIGLGIASYGVPLFYQNISLTARRIVGEILRVQGFVFWIYMVSTECYFILRSGGDSKNTLLLDSGFMWSVNIPILFVVTYFTNWSYLTLFIIGQSTDIIKMILGWRLLKKEEWVNNLTLG